MMETAQSFTARRSAASNLPAFQLPPPDHLSQHKYQPAYAPSTSQPTPAMASSVLTPPSGLQSDLSPLGAASVNSQSSGSSAGGPPYQPMGYWPTPGNSGSYTYSQPPPMPPTFAQGQQNYNNMGRPLYSPSMNYPNRNTNSPASGEGLPPPPYDISLPPFPTSMSGGQPQSLPQLAPQQHQQQQQQQQNQQQAQQQQQGPPQQQQNQPQHQQQAVSQAPPQGPLHAPNNYGERPPPTPTNYYTPSSTPQQSSFPAYAQQSPTQQSPNTSSAPSNRISPVSAQPHPSMAAPQGYPRPSYSGYSLPAMAGPIMSNVHSPGNQMALVGGMNMPYPPHQMGAPMYGHHPQQQQQNDRPFKCDQCPQSFNRNHDLKRHKRIHLAVKPFPCGHCEKSFSRKDALKRHILVKGCGKAANGNTNAGGSQSPVDKSEIMSDSTEGGSPEMMKKEM
ncbi:related to finger protein [Phialocephala subalpina]|uniref:Related to finger protein n=1 Tax=Phialocephala subalpina TaxID=576137 RepID=A0A1L7WFM9_9HELO|nr:related to finger protein [Phialocephala subalpina]